MTTMLAAVLAWNPLLVYSPGFQLSVAAVFGILLLRKPLQAFVKSTVLRPFEKPPELLSNLLAVSLAAQIATTPIIATSFEEVSAIGLLTNLVAVPLSGPILTLGLLGTFAGNIVAPLAYRINASNGFLVTVLIWVAEAASALPIARRGDTGCDASPGRALLPGLYSCCRRRSNAPLEALAEGREPARRMGSTLDCSHRRAFVTLHSFASCLAPVSSARPEVSRSSQGPGNGTPRRGGCQS